MVPSQLVHAPAPDERLAARVRQHQDEAVQHLRPLADVQVGELAPIDLGLGARHRLDAPEGPQPRLGVTRPHEAEHRLVRTGVGVVAT
jgi:hypothetical protein